MTTSIGIDCGHSLAASTWILQRDGTPLAGGKCDALPELYKTAIICPGWWVGYDDGKCELVDHITIESIHAEASFNSTGKVRQYGKAHNVSGTLFTEGYLFRHFTLFYPSLPVHLIPRVTILQAFLGRWPYRKGEKVDKTVLTTLQASHGPYCKRSQLLSTVDARDAYLAAIYLPG